MVPTSLSSSVQAIGIENVLSSPLGTDQPMSGLLNVSSASISANDTVSTSTEVVSRFADFTQPSFAATLTHSSSSHLSSSQVKLNHLFDIERDYMENLTDEHWKCPEYPLARIKKIMRMDEDVKMISGEVPVLFSKAIEIFVTELTLRAWIYTEDTKRRTVQRGDIAMAIAKNDMFDFLIDIVPREEIHSRTKTTTKVNAQHNESTCNDNSVSSSDLLQTYVQLLSQQNDASSIDCQRSDVITNDSTIANLAATSTLMQQQMQLLQQLAHIQQQQSQERESLEPTNKCTITDNVSTSSSHFSTLDVSNCTNHTSGDSHILNAKNLHFHFQPHEHSATDIVTLLSSEVDHLPVTSQQLSLFTSSTSELNLDGCSASQVPVHPTVVTEPFETEQLSIDGTNRLYTTDEYTSGHFNT